MITLDRTTQLLPGDASGSDGGLLRGNAGGGCADARPGRLPQGHQRRRKDGGRQPGSPFRTGEDYAKFSFILIRTY